MFQKKHKTFKAIFAILCCSKPKIFSVDQTMTDIFSRPPPLLPNYFSAATALSG